MSKITVRVPVGDRVVDMIRKTRELQQSLSVCFMQVTQPPAGIGELIMLRKGVYTLEG